MSTEEQTELETQMKKRGRPPLPLEEKLRRRIEKEEKRRGRPLTAEEKEQKRNHLLKPRKKVITSIPSGPKSLPRYHWWKNEIDEKMCQGYPELTNLTVKEKEQLSRAFQSALVTSFFRVSDELYENMLTHCFPGELVGTTVDYGCEPYHIIHEIRPYFNCFQFFIMSSQKISSGNVTFFRSEDFWDPHLSAYFFFQHCLMNAEKNLLFGLHQIEKLQHMVDKQNTPNLMHNRVLHAQLSWALNPTD